MGYILSTLVMGAIIWWFALGPGRKAGEKLTPLTRKLIGAVAGGAGLLLALRGRFDVAILLLSLSGWLLGVKLPAMLDPVGRARRSDIRTAALFISIDLGTGAIDAEIRAGRYAGQRLGRLSGNDLVTFAREMARLDPQGLSLVMQDLDRRAPGWRQYVQFDPEAGQGAATHAAELREEEAYQILGLQPGVGEEAIRAAHRALIGRLHPDRGGSTHLAALVNRAKDVALAGLRKP